MNQKRRDRHEWSGPAPDCNWESWQREVYRAGCTEHLPTTSCLVWDQVQDGSHHPEMSPALSALARNVRISGEIIITTGLARSTTTPDEGLPFCRETIYWYLQVQHVEIVNNPSEDIRLELEQRTDNYTGNSRHMLIWYFPTWRNVQDQELLSIARSR